MTNLLHIYAQSQQHDEAWIVGDREGLTRLRDAITSALESRPSAAHSFTADGEGFAAIVVLSGEARIERLALPYSDMRHEGDAPPELLAAGEYGRLAKGTDT